jgi:hypothetical protein
MVFSGQKSYHFTAKRGVIGLRGQPALTGPNAKKASASAAEAALAADGRNLSNQNAYRSENWINRGVPTVLVILPNGPVVSGCPVI